MIKMPARGLVFSTEPWRGFYRAGRFAFSPSTQPPRIPLYRLALAAALLIIAVTYLQTVFFEYTYDDFGQIVFNPGLRSWKVSLQYFGSDVWAQVGGMPLYYRPVFMLWLRVNYFLFGLHPIYWHIVAVGMHLFSCLLLYYFTCQLTRNRWVAVTSAFLFGLHPVHVESVAWISGTTETLLTTLLFGSLLAYLKKRDANSAVERRLWLAASMLLAFLAVMAKETGLILPALVFSYEYIFSKCDAARKIRLRVAARAALPYLLIAIAYVVIRAIALARLTPPHTHQGLVSVILAWPKVLMFYVAHTLFPVRLSAFYNLITIQRPDFQNLALPLILISLGALALCYGSQRSRVFAFLSLWGIIMFVPILNVTALYNVENVHDRYLYLPTVAFCVMLASLLGYIKDLISVRAAMIPLVAISAVYIMVTARESGQWLNDFTLGERGMAMAPGNAVAPQLLGNAYIRHDRIAEAIPYLLDSLEVQPLNSDTLTSLGICYLAQDALPLAEKFLSRAILLNRSKPRAHFLLGLVRFKQGRLGEAEKEIRIGMKLKGPSRAVYEFHFYLGEILYAKGDIRGAVSEYRRELDNDGEVDPVVEMAKTRLNDIEKAP